MADHLAGQLRWKTCLELPLAAGTHIQGGLAQNDTLHTEVLEQLLEHIYRCGDVFRQREVDYPGAVRDSQTGVSDQQPVGVSIRASSAAISRFRMPVSVIIPPSPYLRS